MDVFNYFFLLNRMTMHDKTIYRVLAMVEKFCYIFVIGMWSCQCICMGGMLCIVIRLYPTIIQHCAY